jgi:Uma2 family endonuclease
MVKPHMSFDVTGPWTIEDLASTPDDGMRYEIFDGSLLVSPAPRLPHARGVHRLRRRLEAQAPSHLAVAENTGVVFKDGRSCFIPDIVVVPDAALDRPDLALPPGDVLLAVEVLSPNNADHDRVTKRYAYAEAGIPHYWILDREGKALTMLALEAPRRRYQEAAVVGPGRTFRASEPFPVEIDPGELF